MLLHEITRAEAEGEETVIVEAIIEKPSKEDQAIIDEIKKEEEDSKDNASNPKPKTKPKSGDKK